MAHLRPKGGPPQKEAFVSRIQQGARINRVVVGVPALGASWRRDYVLGRSTSVPGAQLLCSFPGPCAPSWHSLPLHWAGPLANGPVGQGRCSVAGRRSVSSSQCAVNAAGPTFTVPLLANCLGDHVGDCLIRLEELIAANFLQILTNEDDNDRPADAWNAYTYPTRAWSPGSKPASPMTEFRQRPTLISFLFGDTDHPEFFFKKTPSESPIFLTFHFLKHFLIFFGEFNSKKHSRW